MKAIELLKKYDICEEAIEWMGDKTIQEAWDTCHSGDWMIYIYPKICPGNLKKFILTQAHCVNKIRHLMKDERSIKTIDATIAYGEGKIEWKEINKMLSIAFDAAYESYLTYKGADVYDVNNAEYVDIDSSVYAAHGNTSVYDFSAAYAAYTAFYTAYNDINAATHAVTYAAYAYAAYAAYTTATYADAIYTDINAYTNIFDIAKKAYLLQIADMCRKCLTIDFKKLGE